MKKHVKDINRQLVKDALEKGMDKSSCKFRKAANEMEKVIEDEFFDALRKMGRRIQIARKVSGLSQLTLGKKAQASRQTVVSWEKGETMPSLKQLFLIAKATGQDVEYFIGKAELKTF